ncbi:TetR/AcrR family transcriptional regulator [Erwinia sp. V71]|uniref:TetR/AcrR family transcriptional regulator n=1 Tax=Erwinia sp. V71 TaxID=3369424 RepID=UPI003F6448DB
MRTLTDEKRNAIIAAASAVFQEFGYERASMNEVARRAGGSKATLYNYFDSKEALFQTVVRTYSTHFLTGAAEELVTPESESLTLEQKLTRFGERLLGVLARDSQALALYRVVVGEAGHSDIGKLFQEAGTQESMEALAGLMRQHIDSGELRDGDAMLRAKQFSALLRAEVDSLLVQRETPRYSEQNIRTMVASAVDLFQGGARRAG